MLFYCFIVCFTRLSYVFVVVEYLFFWWNLRFLFFGLLFGFGVFLSIFVFLVFAKLCSFHTNICIFFTKFYIFHTKFCDFLTKLCEFFSNICFVCLRTFCWFWLFVLFFIFGGFFGLEICIPLGLTLLFVGIRILVLWASFRSILQLKMYCCKCKAIIVHDLSRFIFEFETPLFQLYYIVSSSKYIVRTIFGLMFLPHYTIRRCLTDDFNWKGN